MFNYLPERIKNSIEKLDFLRLNEIRLYDDGQVLLKYANKLQPLTENNRLTGKNMPVCLEKGELGGIIEKLTFRSLYAFNDKIVHGFLTGENGERIGLAGEFVFDGKEIKTIKNYSSINIRLHHNVIGCSNGLYEKILKSKLANVMIFSKPGMGKTTLIRDLIRNLSEKRENTVLVVDERDEIVSNNKFFGVDVLKNCSKKYAFENGVRSLSPDVIITDELYGDEDYSAVLRAINAGVKVIATSHANDIKLFSPYVFDYYVELDAEIIGKIKKIFNGKGEEISYD